MKTTKLPKPGQKTKTKLSLQAKNSGPSLVYEIIYAKSIQKDIKRLPKEKLRKIRETIEKKLTTNPYACEKLTGEFEGQHKLVAWPYRIIFTISGKQITILRIRHRKESYR